MKNSSALRLPFAMLENHTGKQLRQRRPPMSRLKTVCGQDQRLLHLRVAPRLAPSAAQQVLASWQFLIASSIACSGLFSSLCSDEKVLRNSYGSVTRS